MRVEVIGIFSFKILLLNTSKNPFGGHDKWEIFG